MSRKGQRTGMTATELVVVIGIIGVLIGITIPAVMRIRSIAQITACQNNMKQIGLALSNYLAAFERYPLGCEGTVDPDGGAGTTWAVRILPYVEQEEVYRSINFSLTDPASGSAFTNTANSMGANAPTASVVEGFLCPADGIGGKLSVTSFGTYSHSNYVAIFGQHTAGVETPSAAFGINYGANYGDFTDGMSNTMVVSEGLTGVPQSTDANDVRGVFWLDRAGSSQLYTSARPNTGVGDVLRVGTCFDDPGMNLACEESSNEGLETAYARSRHFIGVNALMGDGSVRMISKNVNLTTWQALGTTQGGETITDDDAVASAAPSASSQGPAYLKDRYVVTLQKNGKKASSLAGYLNKLGATDVHFYQKALNGFSARIPASAVSKIQALPSVKSVDKDRIWTYCGQQIPTGVSRIGCLGDKYVLGTSKFGTGYVNATVAVLDTGIDNTVPDLNVVSSQGAGSYSNGFDVDNHGTNMASIIGAINNTIDVVGVCPGASLWSIKCFGSGGNASTSDVLAALDIVSSNVPAIQVCSIAIGDGTAGGGQFNSYPAVQVPLDGLWTAGVFVSVPAGNSFHFGGGVNLATGGPMGGPAFAGTLQSCLVVGALSDSDGLPGGAGPALPNGDADDTYASFSNYGTRVDLIAPGNTILAINAGGALADVTGTGAAAAHAAGAAAYLIAINGATPAIYETVESNQGIRNLAGVQEIVVQAATAGVTLSPDQVKQMILQAVPYGLQDATKYNTVTPLSGDTSGVSSYVVLNMRQF